MSADQTKKKVFLYPSDIAAYIGQNQYDFVTPFERLWKRCDPESYTEIINQSKTKLDLQKKELENLCTQIFRPRGSCQLSDLLEKIKANEQRNRHKTGTEVFQKHTEKKKHRVSNQRFY